MNKEKRKQIVLDKKLSRVWQSYKDVKKDKQLELTNHSFSFHKATISAIGGGEQEVQARRDVEIVIPDPGRSFYEDYPDIYWPKTGCDLRLYFQ